MCIRDSINWIRRLTLSVDNAKAMLDALVIDDELSYNVADLSKMCIRDSSSGGYNADLYRTLEPD